MILAFLLILFVGCKDFETKKISSEEVLNEQLSHFNWNSVDVYPSFAECQELMEKPDLKKCFERILVENIHKELAKHQIIAEDSIRETATLYLLISAEGEPKIDSLLLSEKLRAEVPELKNWLENSIQSLPTIFPARTRGIPVATKFILPIQVVSE
ncbi:MAG TPA: hypothetical protein VFM82_05175 [Flavobacteriaceae bacterium]|nr:hypothetical protein [Flavobacteriaceae bacterium]